MSSLRPGDTVCDKFLIESVLGSGGMGVVFQAVHIRLQTRVALKVLDMGRAASAPNVARFEREALAAARLRSPYSVRVHDVDTTESGAPFLVMELLRGVNLSKVLKQSPRPREQLVDWAIQICSAVHEAHQLGVIHRDLKPSNIFVLECDERIKVVDFGISKIHDAVELTADSEILGTPKYMSPEQLQGQQVVPQSDVWAIGVVLYGMLVRVHPFAVPPNSPPLVFAAATLTQEPVPILAHQPDLPEGLAEAVMGCLRTALGERCSTARELAARLQPYGSGKVEFEEVPRALHDAGPVRKLSLSVPSVSGRGEPLGVRVPLGSVSETDKVVFFEAAPALMMLDDQARAAAEAAHRREVGRWVAVGGAALALVVAAAGYAMVSGGESVDSTGGVGVESTRGLVDAPRGQMAAMPGDAASDSGTSFGTAKAAPSASGDERPEPTEAIVPPTGKSGKSSNTRPKTRSKPPARPDNPLYLP